MHVPQTRLSVNAALILITFSLNLLVSLLFSERVISSHIDFAEIV